MVCKCNEIQWRELRSVLMMEQVSLSSSGRDQKLSAYLGHLQDAGKAASAAPSGCYTLKRCVG